MALHRDIYWVGKQWTVTGAGLQLIDQRRKGEFDIDLARLWQDNLLEHIRAQAWLDGDDFAKGLSIARARYPRPLDGKEPAEVNVRDSVATAKPVQPETAAARYHMKLVGVRAKFLRPWRIRIRK